MNIIQSPT